MTGTESRIWRLRNLDTGEVVEGQFEPTEMRERFGSDWVKIQSLGRARPFLQFVGGISNEVSFVGFVFAQHSEDRRPEIEVAIIRRWATKARELERPPILSFTVGDGHVALDECVIDGEVEVNYERMKSGGGMLGARVSMRLTRFDQFKLETGIANANTESGFPESRYANAQAGDYYELLCAREYGNPLLGDAIRKRNPSLSTLKVGDVVKLPSIAAIRDMVLEPTSPPLFGTQRRKPTSERLNYLDTVARRSVGRTTHYLKQ